MAIYGYARVSSTSQDLEIQISALKEAGAEIIRSEKVTGTSVKDRHELNTLLEFLREGDTLLITRIDRLARSVGDLQNIVGELKNKGVSLKAIEQPIDTSTAAGKAFLDMLSVFAEFETNLRKERQMEGIAKARAKGTKFGRKKQLTDEAIHSIASMREGGMTVPQIMKDTGLSKASVYRALARN